MPAQDTPSPIEPEVQDLLSRILSGVQEVLGQTFVGMYLTGSLATGSFKPGRSDIDFGRHRWRVGSRPDRRIGSDARSPGCRQL